MCVPLSLYIEARQKCVRAGRGIEHGMTDSVAPRQNMDYQHASVKAARWESDSYFGRGTVRSR